MTTTHPVKRVIGRIYRMGDKTVRFFLGGGSGGWRGREGTYIRNIIHMCVTTQQKGGRRVTPVPNK